MDVSFYVMRQFARINERWWLRYPVRVLSFAAGFALVWKLGIH